MNIITQTIKGNFQDISIETGKLAKQADGSVVVKSGGTMLLATVVSNEGAKEGVDFLPLTVDYREKFAAAGKFPGGFIKREARPADYEILTSRLIDRALRPLFPSDYHSETQLMVQLISTDGETQPDSLACLAASAALAVSDIPFDGPVSECRVARINGEMVINPSKTDLELADIDIMVAASLENIIMIEGEMSEISEVEMLEAIKAAHDAIKLQCNAQIEMASQIEKATTKRAYSHETHNEELKEQIFTACYEKCASVAAEGTADKHLRSANFKAIKEEYIATLEEELAAENSFLIGKYFHDVEKKAVRDTILNKGIRLDGRKTTEIRGIWSEIDYLPNTHGSAIFTRGETQSLTTVTLGSKMDEQNVDGAFHKGSDKFILHYNFPPFSTGEARPIRGVSRREVGHGNLAHRALKGMIPADEIPYTVRVVSDILESNGSSSMATVCAGTLALMDAGIKIKKPVSGIAMGLITEGNERFAVLSDILGDEDHLGDMDFKVTGTKDGITACQMDIKVAGLSFEIMEQALEQAKEGRMHILNEMSKTISEPKDDYKPFAPRIVEMRIPKDLIGAVIGPGGKIIQEMQKETETVITIEEVEDEGVINIVASDKNAIDMAKAKIRAITAQPEVGEIYIGKVKAIQSYGAFVEILPGKDGLLHISELDHKRIQNVGDVVKEGETIEVKLIGIDPKTKKLKLSRKALLPKPEGNDEA